MNNNKCSLKTTSARWAPALLLTFTMTFAVPALAGPKVYVPMGSANEIIVIDSTTDKIINTIQGVKNSHGLAGTSDGQFLIAASLSQQQADAALPAKPDGMSENAHKSHHSSAPAPTTDGKAKPKYVSHLTIIQTKDNTIIRKVRVPGAVHHMLVTPDDKFAIATHQGAGSVSIVNLKTYAVKTIRTGRVPNYAVASPDSKFVYVSNSGDGIISKISTENWAVVDTFAVGKKPEHMTISSDGSLLFVNNVGDGTVSEIALNKGTVQQTFAVGGNLHGLDLSDDDKTLFVAGKGENKIVAITVKTGAMTTQPLAPGPYHLAAITGMNKLYVSSLGEKKIWVIDQKSLQAIAEIPVPARAHQMVVAN